MNYTYSLDNLINPTGTISREEKNAVILMGTGSDKKIPVQSLGKEFKFNFKIYNKSADALNLENAISYFRENIAPLSPEGILIHLGENDINTCISESEKFDATFLSLIKLVRMANKKCRIALVSVNNPHNDKTVNVVNRHIKAIAQAEKCSFVNLENAHLWNPEGTKAAVEFAHSMGLNTRKPLSDVAEILYSYAFNAALEEAPVTHLVG